MTMMMMMCCRSNEQRDPAERPEAGQWRQSDGGHEFRHHGNECKYTGTS